MTALIQATLFMFASYGLWAAIAMRRGAHRDALRYRFYAARDRLYLAGADGLLPVESKEFKDARALIEPNN